MEARSDADTGGPKLVRVHPDKSGDTVLSNVSLSTEPSGASALRGVPVTTATFVALAQRAPFARLHPPPRRQFVVVLRGRFEVTTTSGMSATFGPGDCLLADDLDSPGHTFEDVGEEPLVTLQVGVAPDWEPPSLAIPAPPS